jgi:hypothetical protein
VTRFLVCLLLASLASTAVARQPDCPSPPTVIVDDYVIQGSAANDQGPRPWTEVSLYSRGKLVRRVVTDANAQFTFDNLSWGTYRLSIQGVGSFPMKVEVTAVKPPHQRYYYGFSKMRGCLSWGFSTN